MKKTLLKILCLILCVAVLSVSLLACGGNEENGGNNNNGTTNNGGSTNNGGDSGNNGVDGDGDYVDVPDDGEDNYGGVPDSWIP